jgi:hypothetical protein
MIQRTVSRNLLDEPSSLPIQNRPPLLNTQSGGQNGQRLLPTLWQVTGINAR